MSILQRPTSVDTAPVTVVDTARSPHARLRPVGLRQVRLTGGFWSPVVQRNREVTLEAQYRQLEASGTLDNFRRAAGKGDGEFQGMWFADSDVYKWLEAVSWTLASGPSAPLERLAEEAIALVRAAQEPDGYLDTYYSGERAPLRWSDLPTMHEMYCAGHLIQAAVAHQRATGSTELLEVAVRVAEHVDRTFGPGGRPGADGHPGIEMALVELARLTGERRWLELARWLVEQRGLVPPAISGRAYHQDHVPFTEQREPVGHAVRGLYLYCAAADLVAETGPARYRRALDALWSSLHGRRIYVTGGVGARWDNEAFGDDYELPNRRAHAETCAGIAEVFWAWRMLQLDGDGRYREALETALFNAVLVGVGGRGDEFFYQNPLSDRGTHRRAPWFPCACCPPNLARLLASLPAYLYSTGDDGLWVHLYAGSDVTAELPGGLGVTLAQRTDYPWEGEVAIEVGPDRPADFTLYLPVPPQTPRPRVSVNGRELAGPEVTRGYLALRRTWRPGDTVRVTVDLAPRLLAAHPHVEDDLGRVALVRGPIVYCLEQADHDGADVWDLRVPLDARWEERFDRRLPGGCVVLTTMGEVADPGSDAGEGPLYRDVSQDPPPRRRPQRLTAVPYFAWANREPGAMAVWVPLT
jgi:uncharacterized protein